MSAICTSCGNPLRKRTLQKIAAGLPVTGLCWPCWRAATKGPTPCCTDCGTRISKMAKAGRCRSCASLIRERDPEFRARRLASMRAALQRPEVLAMKQRVARANGAAHLKWLPAEYRDEYHSLRHRTGLNAAAARARIEAKMSPFERQLAKLREGKARIVEVQPIRMPEYAFTLGGVTPEIL